jgi:hypothetical protein
MSAINFRRAFFLYYESLQKSMFIPLTAGPLPGFKAHGSAQRGIRVRMKSSGPRNTGIIKRFGVRLVVDMRARG